MQVMRARSLGRAGESRPARVVVDDANGWIEAIVQRRCIL
jgi:hypothetical protein